MKAVILAGGLGTRLSEETALKPKPMVEIGGKPILWHIMKIYAHHGITDFIICCGYKSYSIKEYFMNYFSHQSDITINLKDNTSTIHKKRAEPWSVTLVDTGEDTMTGGRLSRVRDYIGNEEDFFFTYGDGVGDIDIQGALSFHKKHGKLATLTSVTPPGRFGAIDVSEDSSVKKFVEKPIGDGGRINGGFFVLSPSVIDLINGDDCVWEQEPLKTLAKNGELYSYRHNGFWHPMDSLRDKNYLEELWNSGKAPWKMW
ncbi:glucose-1-phosphate cytidylyltransferase [Gammaproteobacteria bacterium]|nr:glucose-1-phosphate cytidylyltransferase [Gammaproteobacteria bacterium]